MIPIINQAMMLGYTASQILSFIQNKIPNMSSGVTSARKRGYRDEDILKFLSSKVPVNKEESKGQGSDYLSSVGIKTKEQRKNDRNKAIKSAIGIGATALTAYKAYQNYSGIAQGLTNYFTGGNPQQPTLTNPNTPNPTPLNNAQNAPPPSPNQTPSPMQATPGQVIGAQNNTPTQANQIAQAAQAIPNQQPQINSESIIDQMGIKDNILNLQNAGNSPDQIAAALEFQMKPAQKSWIKSQTQLPFNEIIKDYVQKLPNMAKGNAQNDQIQQENALTQPIPEKIEPQKIQKGSEVLTPNGIGTVKGEDSKGFIVESDGKTKKIPYEEAISSPLPEKDMADLYTDLVNKIPESERSSMINVAGYDPNVNEFIFMPHDGALYVYKDIPEEFAEKIKHALFKAKTTGSNFYGVWSKGEDTRGGGLSALIKELQKLYGGKGKEYVRKYEKVYDLFALPKAAIKEKERMEREKRKKSKRPS